MTTSEEDDRSSYITLAMHNASKSDTSPSGSSQDLLNTNERKNERNQTHYVAAPLEEFTEVRHVPDRLRDTLRMILLDELWLANRGGQWREQIVDSTLAETSSTWHGSLESRASNVRSRATILSRENLRLLLSLRHSARVRGLGISTRLKVHADVLERSIPRIHWNG